MLVCDKSFSTLAFARSFGLYLKLISASILALFNNFCISDELVDLKYLLYQKALANSFTILALAYNLGI
ncbi:hypothetical protein M0802_011338 [Mischocyttarus mexicanus]|nr:hypothetical protein M0802_011338 [Mischocyttarus mexicanus]